MVRHEISAKRVRHRPTAARAALIHRSFRTQRRAKNLFIYRRDVDRSFGVACKRKRAGACLCGERCFAGFDNAVVLHTRNELREVRERPTMVA